MEALWLSRGKTLKRVYDVKSENELFLGIGGEYFPQFSQRDRIRAFAFWVHNYQHLNENTNSQEACHLVHEMFKLKLWKLQLLSKKHNTLSNFETGKAHSFKFCGQNPALLIRLGSLVFKMYASVKPQSPYCRRQLILMLKEFQSSFKWRLPLPMGLQTYAGSHYITNSSQNVN